jgi:hypothetical protein
MSFSIVFWVLMLIWLVFGFAWNSNPGAFGPSGIWGNLLLLFVLFALLGWHVFPIHG